MHNMPTRKFEKQKITDNSCFKESTGMLTVVSYNNYIA